MTFQTPLLIAALAAAALTTQAAAQGRMPMTDDRPEFAELDADGDGLLTPEDLRAPMADRFAAADADGNGALSTEEMTAMMEAHRADRMARMAARMLERLDADGSGDLSLAELVQAEPRQAMFDRLDADGDGAISEEEFAAHGDGEGEGRRGHHGGRHGHGGGHGGRF
jgi:hypothetical protein